MRLLILYLASFAFPTIVFILLFHTPIFAGSILFFRGLAFLLICSITLTVCLLRLRHYLSFITYKDILVSLVLFLCLNLTFFVLVPVTLERSISVYLLAYLNRQTQPSLPADINTDFNRYYLADGAALNKRYTEQLASGNISQSGKGYQLTPRGRKVVQLFHLLGRWFGISQFTR